MHINNWQEDQFAKFEDFINKNNKKIITLDYIINLANPNFFQFATNYLVEKTLKTIRIFI